MPTEEKREKRKNKTLRTIRIETEDRVGGDTLIELGVQISDQQVAGVCEQELDARLALVRVAQDGLERADVVGRNLLALHALDGCNVLFNELRTGRDTAKERNSKERKSKDRKSDGETQKRR